MTEDTANAMVEFIENLKIVVDRINAGESINKQRFNDAADAFADALIGCLENDEMPKSRG